MPLISVAGVYQTDVTLEANDCPGQTVERHPTIVKQTPGATTLTLTQAGSAYAGTLAADGSFSTTPVTQMFDGVNFRISITGQFGATDLDALVLVEPGRQPPCTFTARWAGPKATGPPNVIP